MATANRLLPEGNAGTWNKGVVPAQSAESHQLSPVPASRSAMSRRTRCAQVWGKTVWPLLAGNDKITTAPNLSRWLYGGLLRDPALLPAS